MNHYHHPGNNHGTQGNPPRCVCKNMLRNWRRNFWLLPHVENSSNGTFSSSGHFPQFLRKAGDNERKNGTWTMKQWSKVLFVQRCSAHQPRGCVHVELHEVQKVTTKLTFPSDIVTSVHTRVHAHTHLFTRARPNLKICRTDECRCLSLLGQSVSCRSWRLDSFLAFLRQCL